MFEVIKNVRLFKRLEKKAEEFVSVIYEFCFVDNKRKTFFVQYTTRCISLRKCTKYHVITS